ncbi:MAG: fibronectin type III domain-containing protein, partial [Actinomycetota bacterium]|nr:fibronectin type III domain-containing protein [Actinomycetota bacterium]
MVGTVLALSSDPVAAAVSYPPAPLLNADLLSTASALLNFDSGIFAATPTEHTALTDLEQRAVTNTLKDHGLTDSDAAAAQTWGRNDALAELYALILDAINTPVGQRTTDQSGAVAWFTSVVQRQQVQSANNAGLEYAKWAGLGATNYEDLLATNPTEAQLQAFLSPNPRAFTSGENLNTPSSTRNEGYCVYVSPSGASSPYADNIYGSTASQTCYTPCSDPTVCEPAAPSYGQFVDWGTADADDALLGSSAANLPGAAVGMSASLQFGVPAAAFGDGAVLTAGALSTLSVETLDAVQAAAGPLVFASIEGSIVGFVIAALAGAVVEAVNVFQAAALPGQLATLIAQAPTTVPDLKAMSSDTKGGAAELLSLFLSATLPQPSLSTCNNDSVTVGGSGAVPPVPCLNATAIPAQASSDPEFNVTRKGSQTTDVTPTISWADAGGKSNNTAYLSGNWFVDSSTPQAGGASTTTQDLEITYTDWNGHEQTAWLIDQNGSYSFLTVQQQATGLDPSTCKANGTCASATSIDYVGTDGNDYTASVSPPPAAPNAPTLLTAISTSSDTGITATFSAATSGVTPSSYTLTATNTTPQRCLLCPAPPGPVSQTGTASPITVSGLVAGDTYSVTVTAANAVGAPSPASNAITVVLSLPGAPSAPRNPVAVAGPGLDQVTITFDPPASSGESPISGYTVSSTTPSQVKPYNQPDTATGATSPITVTIGLLATPNPSYQFTVTATNAQGTGPASKTTNAVSIAAPPGPPTGVSAVAGNARATVAFTTPASNGGSTITGYTVTAADQTNPAHGGQTATGSNSPITVTGLTNGDSYTFT